MLDAGGGRIFTPLEAVELRMDSAKGGLLQPELDGTLRWSGPSPVDYRLHLAASRQLGGETPEQLDSSLRRFLQLPH